MCVCVFLFEGLGFLKNWGYHSEGPYHKNFSTLGSILGTLLSKGTTIYLLGISRKYGSRGSIGKIFLYFLTYNQ